MQRSTTTDTSSDESAWWMELFESDTWATAMLKKGYEPVRVGPLNNDPKPVYALTILYPEKQASDPYPTARDFEPEMLLKSLKGEVSLSTLEMSTREMTVNLGGILERLHIATLADTSGLTSDDSHTFGVLSYGMPKAQEYQVLRFGNGILSIETTPMIILRPHSEAAMEERSSKGAPIGLERLEYEWCGRPEHVDGARAEA